MQKHFRNLPDILFDRALRHGHRIAFQYIGRRSGTISTLTFESLHDQAQVLACHLRQRLPQGGRAVLLFPQSLDFVVAFMACLRAGVVAVPLSLPINRQGQSRLLGVLQDSEPGVILTLAATRLSPECVGVAELRPDLPWLCTDEAQLSSGVDLGEIDFPALGPHDVAFLQYTSGSTGVPKGVAVTHENIVANQKMIVSGFGIGEDDILLSWLPLYHDMGLIGFVLQPIFSGITTYMMSPTDLLRRPMQWLKAIEEHKVTISGGPNFGYAFCVERISDEQAVSLDLSSWRIALNGAEPVQDATLRAFSAKFKTARFSDDAHFPCYGLAEATLFVSGGPASQPYRRLEVEAQALESDRVCYAQGGRVLVASGEIAPDLDVQIVNPSTLAVCEPHAVGEIWVAGPCVAVGYWNKTQATEDTFGARLAGSERRYLRTGDLGFITERREIVVTGRIKDLIIIGGKNYYPQDIEAIAERAHPALRASSSAAFVAADSDDGVSVMVELRRDAMPCTQADEIKAAVRRAVSEEAAVRVQGVVLAAPGKVLKTTSGKIRRRDCRAQWLAGQIEDLADTAVGEPALPVVGS